VSGAKGSEDSPLGCLARLWWVGDVSEGDEGLYRGLWVPPFWIRGCKLGCGLCWKCLEGVVLLDYRDSCLLDGRMEKKRSFFILVQKGEV